MLNQDMMFLTRVMGAPFTGSVEKLPAWFAAAMTNPELRTIGRGRLDGMIAALPTEEDAARTPVVEETRARVESLRQNPRARCACESELPFLDCHGRSEP